MTEPVDWMIRANARAKGKRPEFLGDPDKERMLSMLMAVIGEVSVMRERMDTIERLLDAKGTITRADIEGYRPDRAAGYARAAMIREYIARVIRGPQQMMEAMQADDKPVDELSRELRDL